MLPCREEKGNNMHVCSFVQKKKHKKNKPQTETVFTALQPLRPPCSSSDPPSTLSPQGLCTCSPLSLERTAPRLAHSFTSSSPCSNVTFSERPSPATLFRSPLSPSLSPLLCFVFLPSRDCYSKCLLTFSTSRKEALQGHRHRLFGSLSYTLEYCLDHSRHSINIS